MNPVYRKLFQHIEKNITEGGFSLTQLQTQVSGTVKMSKFVSFVHFVGRIT